jgi:CheY-like chemotaxis protein
MIRGDQSAPPTALVVDDEPDNRLMIRALLELDGYRVSEASNGGEALAHLATEPVQVLITDLYMPVMDGFELIQSALRSGRNAPHIVAMSGIVPDLARPTDAEAASLLQVNAILDKPFTRKHLVRALPPMDE